MGSRKLPQMIADMRVDLGDTDVDNRRFTSDELVRGLRRSVSDFSRFLPKDSIYEKTLIFTIEGEVWASPADLSTWVSLANKPIQWNTESVYSATGAKCERNVDYYMDYISGKIQAISGGLIGVSESCTISYTIDQVNIDVSVLTDLIRIDRVVYPVGTVPVSNVSHELYGTILTIVGGAEDEGQSYLTEFNNLAIYYSAEHTMPTESDAGSYPSFLEDTVLLAACAYALFGLAVKTGHLAKDDIDAAEIAITELSDNLAKVEYWLENNTGDVGEDTAHWLKKITTDAASLRTAANTALDALKAYIDKVGQATTGDLDKADAAKEIYMGSTANYVDGAVDPSVKKYLTDGDNTLDDLSIGGEGQEVPTAFANYARVTSEGLVPTLQRHRQFLQENAGYRIQAAAIYEREVGQRLSNLRSYIEQSQGYRDIALTYIQTAAQKASEVTNWFYTVEKLIALAEKYKADAVERRDEAWAIWRDRGQYIGNYTSSSVHQMPR